VLHATIVLPDSRSRIPRGPEGSRRLHHGIIMDFSAHDICPTSSSCASCLIHFGTVLALALHTRLQSGIQKPKIYLDGTIQYGNLTISEEPTNLSTALSDPQWKAAMDSKFSALLQNKTWHLVPPSQDRNLRPC
jgi:hypothetical protein